MSIPDEHSRECLEIRVDRKLNSTDVINALTDLFVLHWVPAFIRSDNDSEFIVQAVRDWIAAIGAKTVYIVPGSPWENGYCEIFYSLKKAQTIIEEWREHYNTKRPHSALGYRPQPRKPSFRWQPDWSCTNIQTGPLDGGRPPPHFAECSDPTLELNIC